MFNNLQKPSDSVQREIQRERKNQDDEFIVQLLEKYLQHVNVSMKTTQNRILKIKVRFRRPYLAASI